MISFIFYLKKSNFSHLIEKKVLEVNLVFSNIFILFRNLFDVFELDSEVTTLEISKEVL